MLHGAVILDARSLTVTVARISALAPCSVLCGVPRWQPEWDGTGDGREG